MDPAVSLFFQLPDRWFQFQAIIFVHKPLLKISADARWMASAPRRANFFEPYAFARSTAPADQLMWMERSQSLSHQRTSAQTQQIESASLSLARRSHHHLDRNRGMRRASLCSSDDVGPKSVPDSGRDLNPHAEHPDSENHPSILPPTVGEAQGTPCPPSGSTLTKASSFRGGTLNVGSPASRFKVEAAGCFLICSINDRTLEASPQ